MRFLADENVEKAVVDILQSLGFDVLYAREKLKGVPDDELIDIANQEGRILITNDKDFGELVYLQKKIAEGILLMRFRSEKSDVKARFIESLIQSSSADLSGNFVVASEAGIRVRSLCKP